MSNASGGADRINPLLAAALAYGKLGWKVFPIREGTKDRPHLKEWGVWATSNPKQITKWWTRWPRANIGLACGPSLIAVVDVDTKENKNGQRTIDLLEVLDGLRLSPTRTLRTPSGGRQYLYAGEVASTVAKIGAHLYDAYKAAGEDPDACGWAAMSCCRRAARSPIPKGILMPASIDGRQTLRSRPSILGSSRPAAPGRNALNISPSP